MIVEVEQQYLILDKLGLMNKKKKSKLVSKRHQY